MSLNLARKFSSLKWPDWLPSIVALLGLSIYLVRIWVYAHTTVSGLDEGAYLYKGYLYVSGVYRPFESYGPLTNKAPLAFIIPGLIQYWFGPGLMAGRYFSIVLGILTLGGTWLATRRIGGAWWGTASIWVFTFSPLIVKLHSAAASEVIIACMLAWLLALSTGEKRLEWALILSAALAAVIILTRQNMVFVLPFLLVYIIWKYGWKTGLKSAAAGALVLVAGHAVYWPNILSMWASWLPEGLIPFLDAFRLPSGGTPSWNPSIDLGNRMVAFFQGVRHHFTILVGSIVALVLWFSSKEKERSKIGNVMFLGLLYFGLVALHAWGAVGSDYDAYSCVFCFTAYLGFFDPVGILLIATCLSTIPQRTSSSTRWLDIGLILLILLAATGVGFSLFRDVGNALLGLPVPRIREGQFLPGTTTLLDLLTNKFALSLVLVKKYIALVLGGLAGLLVLWLAYWLWRIRLKDSLTYAYTAGTTFVVLGFFLSPLLAGTEGRVDCRMDVIRQNEELGAYLASVVPPGSLVYWDGGLSTIPLLYLPDIRIFPPQLNDGYSFRFGGDPDTLYKHGLWNEELRQSWMQSADVFIIEEKRYKDWKPFFTPDLFQEYIRPPVAPSCEQGSGLRIFKRLP
jgi:hypothetical protein